MRDMQSRYLTSVLSVNDHQQHRIVPVTTRRQSTKSITFEYWYMYTVQQLGTFTHLLFQLCDIMQSGII